ncbi:MAG: hypothetical protein NWE84_00420 [Candidatus Bathyarchaeota archaeon]|nr:hypothetical protein [Candidatus Bathyarchaeota archaeon]
MVTLWKIIPGPPFDIPFPLYPPRISLDLTGMPLIISLLSYGSIIGVYISLIGCSIIFLRGNVPGRILKLLTELSTLLGFAEKRHGRQINSCYHIEGGCYDSN